MLTDVRITSRVNVAIPAALIVALIAVVAAVAVRTGANGGGWPSTLPEDMDRLGVEVAAANAKPSLSGGEAVDLARDNAPGLFAIEDVQSEAYLTRAGSDSLTWIVRVSGFAFEEGGPPDEFGSPGPVRVTHFAYLYVDDRTGEVVSIVMKQ